VCYVENTERNFYQSLYKVAAIINSAHTTESVLQSIVETVAKTLGARGCSLMLLTIDQKLLIHAAAYGLSDWYVRKGSVSADRSISEALDGKSVAVLDAAKDERVQYQEQARKEGIVSILSVPMILREKVIGVIRIYTTEPRRFSEDDIYFTGAVANLGAISLENARLLETLQKNHKALKRYYFPFLKDK